MLTPSTKYAFSSPDAPLIDWFDAPTVPPSTTPGAMENVDTRLRPTGTYGAKLSTLIDSPAAVLFMSTRGASDVTVTSSTLPAVSAKGSCVLRPMKTSTPLWTTVA